MQYHKRGDLNLHKFRVDLSKRKTTHNWFNDYFILFYGIFSKISLRDKGIELSLHMVTAAVLQISFLTYIIKENLNWSIKSNLMLWPVSL